MIALVTAVVPAWEAAISCISAGGGSGAPFEGGSSRGALPTPFEAVSSRGALTGCGGRRTPGGAEGHYPPLMLGSRPSSSRDLALIASCAALVSVLGVPGSLSLGNVVPITLQTLGVML